jgi:tRNA-specific 2-thiouridylase
MADTIQKQSKQKVFVGLSGGVDSSVTALLLLEQGFDVTGVFIKTWHPDFLQCDWKGERRDAMRVCAKLNIPFKFLDLEEVYKKEVVDYLVSEYKAGRTPNPDVMCNKSVKFGAFFNWALKQGADYIATGHYVIKKESAGKAHLFESIDPEKDQSYFLWTLPQTVLSKTLFPLGGLLKKDVRKIAKTHGLMTATKPDSQGICFLGHVDIEEFLSHFIETKSGVVLNAKGEVVGSHNGALFYTLGQRHGFAIGSAEQGKHSQYVLKKDVEQNTITVGEKELLEDVAVKYVTLGSVSWINKLPIDGTKLLARFRYHQEPFEVIIHIKENIFSVECVIPQHSVALGQSLVLYTAERECLGGGIIEETR